MLFVVVVVNVFTFVQQIILSNPFRISLWMVKFTNPWTSRSIFILHTHLNVSLSTNTILALPLSSTVNQRRQWRPTPALLPGKSHGQRSLVGYSPWGHDESDMTERLHFHFSLSCVGEGNGNPLQCSCLENPRDREAW